MMRSVQKNFLRELADGSFLSLNLSYLKATKTQTDDVGHDEMRLYEMGTGK
jgi:hypothetical protein